MYWWKGTMIERLLLYIMSITDVVTWQTYGKGCRGSESVQSDGVKCEFDPVCFSFTPDCTIRATDVEPFFRDAPLDCLECSALCQTFRNNSLQDTYFCRSLIWDACRKTCDIFAISIPTPVLVKHPGRMYLQPNTNCRPAVTPTTQALTTLPSVELIPSCRTDQAPRMEGVKNRRLANLTGEEFLGVAGPAACAAYCLANSFPNGTAIQCKSAQYSDGICTLTSTEQAILAAELVPDDGSIYFQKYCFLAALVKNCQDIFYEDSNMILVGVNKVSVDAVSLEECMTECLQAVTKYGFLCKSLMFFYQDLTQNCILNEQTRETRHELFTESPPDEDVSYVELDCQGRDAISPIRADKPLSKSEFRTVMRHASNRHGPSRRPDGRAWPRISGPVDQGYRLLTGQAAGPRGRPIGKQNSNTRKRNKTHART